MRYAIFSDIHSNLEAYEAVISALHKERVDGYYCCGDIVGYGADPIACIDKTQELSPVIVAGNHDWGAVGLVDINNFTDNAKAALMWTMEALTETARDYLRSLSAAHKNDFLLVHGSPNKPEEFGYIFNLNDAYAAFLRMQEEKLRLCFIGHTHSAGVFVEELGYITYNTWPQVRLQPTKKYIVNVGSVGQPRDDNPAAAYCIYDTEAKTIEIKRVDYDIKQAQEKLIKAGLPRILAERLGLGK